MSPSECIDKQITDLIDWRGDLMARLRKLINDADPNIKEDWKWGTAVFVHNGNVCAIGAFKNHVKINFFKGAFLDDPHTLFNAGLEAKSTRSMNIHKDDVVNEAALQDLIRTASDYNRSNGK